MQISRIRLSDKTSRLRPRHVVPKPAQAYEPEVPVKMREWISPALASPDLVLEAQPPSAQRAVQLVHQLCGILPGPRSGGQRVDVLDHALDALPAMAGTPGTP